MDPSHTPGHAEVSEPLGIQLWWHFVSYSIRGYANFDSPMYKHTPMPPFSTDGSSKTLTLHDISTERQSDWLEALSY